MIEMLANYVTQHNIFRSTFAQISCVYRVLCVSQRVLYVVRGILKALTTDLFAFVHFFSSFFSGPSILLPPAHLLVDFRCSLGILRWITPNAVIITWKEKIDKQTNRWCR